MSALSSDDQLHYLEMARVAMAAVPDVIVEEMDISDEELIRLRDQLHEHLNDENKTAEEPVEYILVQEGGSSSELYLHTRDTLEEAVEDRVDCAKDGAYQTTPPVAVPLSLISHPKFCDVVQDLLDSLNDLELVDFPEEEEE